MGFGIQGFVPTLHPTPRILLVEDETSIADTLVYALETEHLEVCHTTTAGEALKILHNPFDLAILDVGLPDMSGFDLCSEIRKSSTLPILFLTARDSEIDRILGLELGGDDYVTKPFSPREVAARVRAILRRTSSRPTAVAKASSTAELLEEEMPEEKRKQFLGNIRRESARSESLVRDLLQLAELERKPHLEHRRPFNLTQLCRELAEENRPRLKENKLTLDTRLEQDIQLTGDAMVIKLAIGNLLDNAIGFSPDGGTITLQLARVDNDAVLHVDDQGPGLPDYAVERSFEHFYSLPLPGGGCRATLGLPAS